MTGGPGRAAGLTGRNRDTTAFKAIAPKLGCSSDSLRIRCQQAERDAGQRAGLASAEKDRIRELERKVWHPLRRGSHDIARCTVERLMNVMVLQGVVRGKPVITTNPDTAQPCPDDKMNRAFVAMPNQLWVSHFTFVSSWQALTATGVFSGPEDHGSGRLIGVRWGAWRVRPLLDNQGCVEDSQCDLSADAIPMLKVPITASVRL